MVTKKGYLVLEDGSCFEGKMVNHSKASGEVVFNTCMVGYEQVISDPSYAGQIIVMTYPLIGNYGINLNNLESDTSWLKGLVLSGLCSTNECQHYKQQMSLAGYLLDNGIPFLYGVDTRAITRLIRNKGSMGGVISSSFHNKEDLITLAANAVKPPSTGYVMQVTRSKTMVLGSGKLRLVLIDFGVKKSILTAFLRRNCQLIVVPANTKADQILAHNPDGLILSNGPGDPSACPYAVSTISQLLGKIPILGICMGHQLLSMALGAKTFKLLFGHRGANHPVKNLQSGKVFITSQNHGYSVDENSLTSTGADVLFRNLNDGTIEGIKHDRLKAISVQFHPEAAPGPQDTQYIIDEFLSLLA